MNPALDFDPLSVIFRIEHCDELDEESVPVSEIFFLNEVSCSSSAIACSTNFSYHFINVPDQSPN